MANGAHTPTGISSSRVQQALSAAVSRETATAAAEPAARKPARNAGEGMRCGGERRARGKGEAGSVVIPEVPRNPQDTPIGRAAEAAVGVRGAGTAARGPAPPAAGS